jgi:hypothetical protein
MSEHRWGTAGWIAAGAVVLAAAGVGRSAEAPEPCCFTNDQYAGVCRVVPAEDETCEGILAYLNNPAAVGKTYCNGTAIRGGWAQTKCGAEEPRLTAPVAPGSARPR